MATERKTKAKKRVPKRKAAVDVTAKKLRTGEVAVWDPSSKSILLVDKPGKASTGSVRIIKGSTFKALEEALGDITVLV